MHDSKIYLQEAGIAQGECSSSMLADLFLYCYEYCYINNSLHLHRYSDDIILIWTNNVTCSTPVTNISYLKLTENSLQNSIINFLDLSLKIIKFADIFDLVTDINYRHL